MSFEDVGYEKRLERVCDLQAARSRFMNNEAMFLKFLYQFPQRSLFDDLTKYITYGDVRAAFETAHTMKGIVGNLFH